MNLNQTTLIGRVTRDPELKAIPSGMKVVSFSLATNRVWKDKNGAKQEETDFHNLVAFGKTAEVIAQYVKKGQLIMAQGRNKTRSWDDKDSGKKMYRTEIIIDTFQFGPKAGSSTSSASKNDDDDELDTIEYPDEMPNADDIPF
jgi:single-strand DNA-binding protein